jgi:hypothetical protein
MTTESKKPSRPRSRKAAAAPPKPAPPPKLAWFTEEWNRLVPEAQRLGINVRQHTSLFESRAVGERRLEWLRKAVADAKRKVQPEGGAPERESCENSMGGRMHAGGGSPCTNQVTP